jgi:hypothetical protein
MRTLLAAVLFAAIASAQRPRVLVSSDIGGTDPDDFQSMVHLLVSADAFDLEGIVSSPYGPGRREHILQVIDLYARDYPKLKSHSPTYPAPDALRAMAKQGAIDGNGPAGFAKATEGSDWIVHCARRPDPRPLHVLVWGGIDDLAQALHDAPDILPKLRVYFIGGPNKMWSADAFDYIEQHHPKLWIIEANSTYRGFFVGGNQTGEWSNTGFVAAHVKGHGALGDFFATLLNGTIKMGDSPSIGWLLHEEWGGHFVRVWDNRKTTFTRPTTAADRVEVFGIVEFLLPFTGKTQVMFDGRVPVAAAREGDQVRFRFSPRDAKVWRYDGGEFTAAPPKSTTPSTVHPNWWTDNQDPAVAEGPHAGAKTVSRFRTDFLADFARRLDRAR